MSEEHPTGLGDSGGVSSRSYAQPQEARTTGLTIRPASGIGAALQAFALIAVGYYLLQARVGPPYGGMVLGVIGSYLAANPLRHMGSVAVAFSVAATLAPMAVLHAGGVLLRGGLVMDLALTVPRAGAGIMAATCGIGLLRWVWAMKRR